MPIYTIPEAVVADLKVKGKSEIGDASTDYIGFFGTTPAVKQTVVTDADITAAATSVATQFNALLDKLITVGILSGT